jgi:hypothetical protein
MENEINNEVYSKVVRAGKRTYFFDVKATKGNDLYLILTESKKSTVNGQEIFEKHKIFLYKEDFDKFQEGLEDVLSKIKQIKENNESFQNDEEYSKYTSISFEDL